MRYETFSPKNQKVAERTIESIKAEARRKYPLSSEAKIEKYAQLILQGLSVFEAEEKAIAGYRM